MALAERWRVLHRGTMAAMLAAERVALARLQRAVDATVRRRRRGPRHLVVGAVARDLETHLAAVLAGIRETARDAGHLTLAREVTAIREAGADLRGDLQPAGMSQADRDRAAQVAGSFAAAWLASSTARLASPETAADALRGGARDQRFRVEMVAATETSQAFNAERENETTEYVQRQSSDLAPLLLKTWDATLDRATCSTCKGLDGTIVPWGFSFPGFAVPGDIHPRCRCIEGMLFLPIPLQAAA